jgi:hypothetical protein
MSPAGGSYIEEPRFLPLSMMLERPEKLVAPTSPWVVCVEKKQPEHFNASYWTGRRCGLKDRRQIVWPQVVKLGNTCHIFESKPQARHTLTGDSTRVMETLATPPAEQARGQSM